MRRLFSVGLALSVLLALMGCSSKVVAPDKIVSEGGLRSHSLSPQSKVSIQVNISGQQDVAEQALRDSLARYGVTDILVSDGYSSDRINIYVYVMKPVTSSVTKYTEIPNVIASMATLFLVPTYDRMDTPVEIHIVDKSLTHKDQVKVVKTQYTARYLIWLPLLAKHGLKNLNINIVTYEGLRRVFDNVLRDNL